MPIDEIIHRVSAICKSHGAEHLSLFGSFAKGTATERSDIDFIVYGCDDIMALLDDIDDIPTLRKIDIPREKYPDSRLQRGSRRELF